MRLIDADKLNRKKKYSFQTVGLPFPKNEWFIKVADLFSAPTVDAVPVVRCGECEKRDRDFISENGDICCPYMEAFMPKDGFCSYGKRKDD